MEYHHKFMPFTWSILIDAAIFAAIYSQKPYFFALHAIGAAAIGTITIVTSFSSFLNGIPPPGNPMRTHKMVGSFLYLLIILQVIVGVLWWLIRSSPKQSELSNKLKKLHKTIGYSLAIIAKLQVLYILSPKTILFWFNLLWDLISIALLIRLKRSKNQSEARP
jgi:cytochrome b561